MAFQLKTPQSGSPSLGPMLASTNNCTNVSYPVKRDSEEKTQTGKKFAGSDDDDGRKPAKQSKSRTLTDLATMARVYRGQISSSRPKRSKHYDWGIAMSIEFCCPNCAKPYRVKDELAGRVAKCVCGQNIKVPLPRNPLQT
jgi:hypothetical protein